MQDIPNKPKHRDLIRGKGLDRGLSLEDKDLGYIGATNDTSLLHMEAVSGGR